MSMSDAAAGSNDTAGSNGAVENSIAQEIVCGGNIKIRFIQD